MVKKRVIPCLDVAGGRVVKGVNFEALREMGDPVELARATPSSARTSSSSSTSPRRSRDAGRSST
jgi:hypothetical protein